MSWSSGLRRILPRTVRTRLTLCYALLFALFAGILLRTEEVLLRRRLRERTDDVLASDVREFTALYGEFGLRALEDEFHREAESKGSENVLLVLRSPGMRILASSDPDPWGEPPPPDPAAQNLDRGEVRFRSLALPEPGQGLRLAETRTDDGNLLQIGRAESDDLALLAAYRRIFVAGVILLPTLAFAIGWLVNGSAMAGVLEVTRTAARIGRSDLTTRVPASRRGREIEDLTAAFNGMLDRIDALVAELREVTDNVAHDLRGPVTRIRGLVEQAVTRPPDSAEFREAGGWIVEECDRLRQLIDTMLEIAQLQAGVMTLGATPVDLNELAADAADLFRPVAEDRGIALQHTPAGGDAVVEGDRPRLQRILANLLDNAIKFTPADGRVTVSVCPGESEVSLQVADTGRGIPKEFQERVFDRFFRAESARSTPGNGLGLPLARALARAHGGDVAVADRPDGGSVFTVRMPRKRPASG